MRLTSNGEIPGEGALYAAVIALSAAILLGSIWSPAPQTQTPGPSAAAAMQGQAIQA
jgi:hypothetical protein